jgi:hypothetical protein
MEGASPAHFACAPMEQGMRGLTMCMEVGTVCVMGVAKAAGGVDGGGVGGGRVRSRCRSAPLILCTPDSLSIRPYSVHLLKTFDI